MLTRLNISDMCDRPERRALPRRSANQLVTLTVFAGDKSISFSSKLVDASRLGIGIIVDSPVAVGSVVEVRASGDVVYGEVIRCAATHRGFRIGVAVEEGLSGEWLLG